MRYKDAIKQLQLCLIMLQIRRTDDDGESKFQKYESYIYSLIREWKIYFRKKCIRPDNSCYCNGTFTENLDGLVAQNKNALELVINTKLDSRTISTLAKIRWGIYGKDYDGP